MKKKILKRFLLGFPIGITIGYTITIIISLIYANGYYSPTVPELINMCGSQINAVILQYFLCGIMGAVFASASLIFENDKWSILKQTSIHFLISSFTLLPIAYIAKWMEHNVKGFIVYFLIFIIIYLLIWFIQYIIWKNNIKRINDNLKK